MATTLKVVLVPGMLLVADRGCWVMLTWGGINEPLRANTPEFWLPPMFGLVNVTDATAWLRPRAARLIFVWYRFGLLAPLFSVDNPLLRSSRPKPLMATLAVVLNQSWALKLNIWLLAPLVKWTTIVPSPP